MKSSWIAGIMGLIVMTALNWSSMCHPSPEGLATKKQIQNVGYAKSVNLTSDEAPTTALSTDYTELVATPQRCRIQGHISRRIAGILLETDVWVLLLKLLKEKDFLHYRLCNSG